MDHLKSKIAINFRRKKADNSKKLLKISKNNNYIYISLLKNSILE